MSYDTRRRDVDVSERGAYDATGKPVVGKRSRDSTAVA